VELVDQAFASTLLPGTSADVEVILSVKNQVLRIPPSTLFEDNKAFVVERGMLSTRTVDIGMRNWDFVEVLGGLSEGDHVVTSLDQEELVEGARVVLRASSETR
jgi:HlyD family secretion protein